MNRLIKKAVMPYSGTTVFLRSGNSFMTRPFVVSRLFND